MADTPPPPPGPWVDNHCHLGHDARGADPDDGAQQLVEARRNGVVGFVTVGCDLASSRDALDWAAKERDVWATAGVHPHESSGGIAGLRELIEANHDGGLVAVGECGLDHFYDHSEPEAQRSVFATQIDLAHEFDLPLVIHTREAWDETFEILDAQGTPERTVFHCFTGGPADAERCLERGGYLSISGIATFPSAQNIRDAIAVTPLDRLMVETDSPYLAPVPYRGRPNQPGWVGHVGVAVAEASGRDLSEVALATTSNAERFYRRTFAATAS